MGGTRHRTLAHAELINTAGIRLVIENPVQGPLVASTCKEPLVRILEYSDQRDSKRRRRRGARQADHRHRGPPIAKNHRCHYRNGIGMNPETLELTGAKGFTTKPAG